MEAGKWMMKMAVGSLNAVLYRKSRDWSMHTTPMGPIVLRVDNGLVNGLPGLGPTHKALEVEGLKMPSGILAVRVSLKDTGLKTHPGR